MRKLLDRIFHLEEISGDGICPTYLYRWTLLRRKAFQVYLHHFVGDDWSLDMHDHPKRFLSIGLRGSYIEETPGDPGLWEAKADDDGVMVRVRWSLPDADGRFLYLRHYAADSWGRNACERQASTWNTEGRRPEYFGAIGDRYPPSSRETRYRAPWLRTFPANHIHRLKLEEGQDCWTLVIVLKAVRPWGFWREGQFIPWREYVRGEGRERKSCP